MTVELNESNVITETHLRIMLKKHDVKITFLKVTPNKDGVREQRTIHAVKESDIPEDKRSKKTGKEFPPGQVPVYEKGVGWRSLYVGTIISFEVLD